MIKDMIRQVEDQFHDLHYDVCNVKLKDEYFQAIKKASHFIRTLEFLQLELDEIMDPRNESWITRANGNLNRIIDIFHTKEPGKYLHGATGIFDEIQKHDTSAARKLVERIETPLSEFLSDAKFVYSLKNIPTEEKKKLKLLLTQVGLNQVVDRLEEADENFVDGNYCAVLLCLRQALENTVKTIIELEGKETKQPFKPDLDALCEMIGAEAICEIVSKIFGYLSKKGVHLRNMDRPTQRDAVFALKQTYLSIEELLNRYLEYSKKLR